MLYSTDIQYYKDRGEGEPERRKDRTIIYDNATPFTQNLLDHMYGSRQAFIDTPTSDMHRWEIDLINFDRLSPFTEFMMGMCDHLDIEAMTGDPGEAVGSYLRDQILTNTQ